MRDGMTDLFAWQRTVNDVAGRLSARRSLSTLLALTVTVCYTQTLTTVRVRAQIVGAVSLIVVFSDVPADFPPAASPRSNRPQNRVLGIAHGDSVHVVETGETVETVETVGGASVSAARGVRSGGTFSVVGAPFR